MAPKPPLDGGRGRKRALHPGIRDTDPSSRLATPVHTELMVSASSDAGRPGLDDAARTDPARLASLHATGLMDSEVEEVFDRLTRLAVRLLGVPTSFISLVDRERDFYKSVSSVGDALSSMQEATGPTFCHHTVARTTPLVIPDTAADPLYRDVPTVRTLGVAAYVGVPLIVGGRAIGAFCAVDTRPHPWTDDEVEVLVELGASAQREIELRVAVALARAATAVAEQRRAELERSNDLLREQAVTLALQSEELHATTAHLEDRTEAAEAANKAKDGFLSMMSHELRTPLNAIGGYAELLAMGLRGPVSPEQIEFLNRIRRAGKHLQTLIGDILEFTHLDSGQTRYSIEDVRVDEVMAEAAELLAPQIAENGIAFFLTGCNDESAGGDRLVRADRKKLRQILINLLTNAIKFTPATGRVSITARKVDAQMLIEVTDSGRGIPPEQFAHIFEPFVQLDRGSITVAQQGVGLGLSICRELAQGMSGDLSVVSTPGAGSVFTVTLPAVSTNAGGIETTG